MSHPVNTTILENHFEDALELSSAELAVELNLKVDITGKPVFNTDAVVVKNVVITHDDLADMVANKRFDEGPDGPC